jgi:hypothetical protein
MLTRPVPWRRTFPKWVVSLERGGVCDHKHIQGYIVASFSSIRAFTNALKTHLGWRGARPASPTRAAAAGPTHATCLTRDPMAAGAPGAKTPTGYRMVCKTVKNTETHNEAFLIGYTQKDMHEPWFETDHEGITERARPRRHPRTLGSAAPPPPHANQVGRALTANMPPIAQEMQEGIDYYSRHGAGPLKTKTALNPHNIFTKATVFHRTKFRSSRVVGFHHVLLSMLQTGKYYPAATWIMQARPRPSRCRCPNRLTCACSHYSSALFAHANPLYPVKDHHAPSPPNSEHSFPSTRADVPHRQYHPSPHCFQRRRRRLSVGLLRARSPRAAE